MYYSFSLVLLNCSGTQPFATDPNFLKLAMKLRILVQLNCNIEFIALFRALSGILKSEHEFFKKGFDDLKIFIDF